MERGEACGCCERLAKQHLELAEEVAALRACLEAAQTLRPEQLAAQLHRQRFQKILRRAPCTFTGSLEECMQAPGMSLQVASLLGHREAIAISQCSKPLRSCLRSVSLELAEIFPPQALLLGGVDGFDEGTSSVESLDIASNTWTPLPRLRVPRWSSAAACTQGRVFVMGGRGFEMMRDEILDSVEVFDMERGSWGQAANLHFPRCELAAASCRGVLVAAHGVTEGEVPLSEVEFLRLEQAVQWLRAPPLQPARRALAAVGLNDAIYLLGGWDDRLGGASGEVHYLKLRDHDIGTEGWRRAPPLQEPRAGFGACALMGSLWACGGCRGPQNLSSIERFTPGNSAWETITQLQEPRRACCAVPSGSSLLILGGVQNEGNYVSSVARFDARRMTWCEAGRLSTPRRYFCACACRAAQRGSI